MNKISKIDKGDAKGCFICLILDFDITVHILMLHSANNTINQTNLAVQT